MKAVRLRFAIITKTRPTKFLTDTGELTDDFEDALLLAPGEVADEQDKLDEPENFETLKVFITAEV